MNKQRLILTVLLVLLSCSLVISYLRMPRQKRVEKLTYVSGMSVAVTKPVQKSLADENRVHLELLDRNRGRAVSVRHNLFRNVLIPENKRSLTPLPPPPPPPPPPKKVVEEEPEDFENESPLPVIVEPTPLQREMARFTFLGFMKKDNRKTIFLSNDKEIFVVKQGDRIAGKYEVTSLTEEVLTISSIQDGGEIIIPLVENKPLNAPKR
jgi:hypothetical protein